MGDVQSEAEFLMKCSVCKQEVAALRNCADGVERCRSCRTAWLDKVHATPVKTPPPSVGEQARFV